MPDLAVFFDPESSRDTDEVLEQIQRVLAPEGGCLEASCLADRRTAVLNALKPFSFLNNQPLTIEGQEDHFLFFDGVLFCENKEHALSELKEAMLSLDPEALQKLNGQFNALLYKPIEKQLVFVTDRLGTRPLYHFSDGFRHVVTSEIKAIPAAMRQSMTFSPLGLLELFAFGHNMMDRTVLRGVRVLPPGSVIKIDPDGLKTTRYFKYRYHPKNHKASNGELGEQIVTCVKNAVSRCLKIEGRKGIFLSGGLDSRIIAGPMGGFSEPLAAFTFGYPDARDVRFAAQLSRLLGFKHQTLTYPEIYLSKVIRQVVGRTECATPFYHTTSLLFHDHVAEKADQIMVGFCGDVFSGGHLRRAMFAKPPESALYGLIFERAICCSQGDLARVFREEIFKDLWDRFVRGFRFSVECIEDQDGPDKADVWDVENRQRRFTFSAPKVDRGRFEVVAPLLDNEVMDLILSLPQRARKNQAAYKHAIVNGFPELKGVPWAATGRAIGLNPLVEQIHEGMRLGKKAFHLAIKKVGIKSQDLEWQFRDVGEEMRRDTDLFKLHLTPYLDSPNFPGHIFDRQGIVDLVEEHRQGRVNASHLLGAVLTVAAFSDLCAEWGFGE